MVWHQRHSILQTVYKSVKYWFPHLSILGKIEGRRSRGDRGWDGWMTSLTQWVWAWANARIQWRAGKPGVLQSMGSQRVRHEGVTGEQYPSSSVLHKLTDYHTFGLLSQLLQRIHSNPPPNSLPLSLESDLESLIINMSCTWELPW